MNITSIKLGQADLLSADTAEPSSHAVKRPKKWTSQELFGGQRELVIVHAEGEYRLRLTSQGKLVLTK